MENFDIYLFAAVALFLVFRLRSVLGRRTGSERPPNDPFGSAPESPEKNAGDSGTADSGSPTRPRGEASAGGNRVKTDPTPLEAGLTQIRIADPGFDLDSFAEGARSAFDMIVASYANGDKDTLRPLLSDEVFDNFARAMDQRDRNNQSLETTLVAIQSVTPTDASMDGRVAFVTLKFVSEQINVMRDADGEVVEGDSNTVARVTDVWTFARNTRSRNPNWTLVATGEAD